MRVCHVRLTTLVGLELLPGIVGEHAMGHVSAHCEGVCAGHGAGQSVDVGSVEGAASGWGARRGNV